MNKTNTNDFHTLQCNVHFLLVSDTAAGVVISLLSGSAGKENQRQWLLWIREQAMDPNCIESLATHDTDIKPHVIER